MIIRHFPDARCKELRFQIGRLELRRESNPVFGDDGEEVIGYRAGDRVEVFRLLACGSTLVQAALAIGGKV